MAKLLAAPLKRAQKLRVAIPSCAHLSSNDGGGRPCSIDNVEEVDALRLSVGRRHVSLEILHAARDRNEYECMCMCNLAGARDAPACAQTQCVQHYDVGYVLSRFGFDIPVGKARYAPLGTA